MTPTLLWPARCGTGEGPVWCDVDQCLWFVDIPGHRLYRYTPASGAQESWPVPQKPGFVVPAEDGRLVVGLAHALAHFDVATGTTTPFVDVEPDRPTNRINDGIADATGRLWFGTMDDAEVAQSGALYSWDVARGLIRHDDGFGVTNGPSFSPDGKSFYLTDSFARTVYAYDHADGVLTNRRTFLTLEAEAGYPDGTTVDEDGGLWIGLWEGSAVRRYATDGALTHEVPVAARNVTKIGFGGTDRRTAYVTTACDGLSEDALANEPHSGGLFRFDAPYAGLPHRRARTA